MRFIISLLFSLCALTSFCQKSEQKFILILPLYNEKSSQRIDEYLTCVQKNLAHPAIEHIHVLYDTTNDDAENKLLTQLQTYPISISYTHKRQTYGDCFALANELYSERTIILSNGDIFFNDSLHKLRSVDFTNLFVVLTCWNVHPDGSLHVRTKGDPNILAYDSQDAWIFRAPLPALDDVDICIGTLGCENRVAYEAQNAGMHLFNPCKTIQACHYHLSGIRHYSRNFPHHLAQRMAVVPCCTFESMVQELGAIHA